MTRKKDHLFLWFSPRIISDSPSDKKTITLPSGKTKQVTITITEKKQELRKELYTQVQELKKNKQKNKSAKDLLQLLNLQEHIEQKYPNTNDIEYNLIENFFLEQLK